MITEARPSIAAPVRAAASGAFRLAELRLWTLGVLAVAYWANVVRGAMPDAVAGASFAFAGVLANGAFCAAAWLLLAGMAGGLASPSAPASSRQIAGSAALCLLCALPTRQASMIALLLMGLQLARAPASPRCRVAATLILALAAETVFTSPYLQPLHAAVARLDAGVVRALLALLGQGGAGRANLVDNDATQFGIEILAPCASSFPLAGVGLAFVVVLVHEGRALQSHDLPWFAASCLASVALTEFRLTWMAAGRASYDWLHGGGGLTVYTLAALVLAVTFPMLAAHRAWRIA